MAVQCLVKELYSLEGKEEGVNSGTDVINKLANASRQSLRRQTQIAEGGLRQAQKTYTEKQIQQVIADYVLAKQVRKEKGINAGIDILEKELRNIRAYLQHQGRESVEKHNQIVKAYQETPEALAELRTDMKGTGSYIKTINSLIGK